jgi:hypothetical protein
MSRNETINAIVFIVFVLAALSCACGLKKWEYDECLQVGHGKNYCVAQAAGCL